MSCLFNALTLLLRSEMKSLKINDMRQTLIEYMEHNQSQTIAGTTIKEWLLMIQEVERSSDYLSGMRLSSTWGGAPEIIIAANFFNVKITIMSRGLKIATFEPEGSKKVKAHLFLHWKNGHYTAIKRINSK